MHKDHVEFQDSNWGWPNIDPTLVLSSWHWATIGPTSFAFFASIQPFHFENKVGKKINHDSEKKDYHKNGMTLRLTYFIVIGIAEGCQDNSQEPLLTLWWRPNVHDGVSNHQPHHCLLNRLFRCTSKKTSKLHVTGLCAGNSSGTGEVPAQMASNVENVSIWWRHHGIHEQ